MKYNIPSNTLLSKKTIKYNNNNIGTRLYSKPSITQDANYFYLAYNTKDYRDYYPSIIVYKISKESFIVENFASKSFVNIPMYQPEIFFDGTGKLWLFLNVWRTDNKFTAGLYDIDFIQRSISNKRISFERNEAIGGIEVMKDGTLRIYRTDSKMSYYSAD